MSNYNKLKVINKIIKNEKIENMEERKIYEFIMEVREENYMEIIKRKIDKLQLQFHKIRYDMRNYLKQWIANNINKENIYLKIIKEEIIKEQERMKIKKEEVKEKFKKYLKKLVNNEVKYNGEKIRYNQNKEKVELIMKYINEIDINEVNEICKKEKYEYDKMIIERIKKKVYATILTIRAYTEKKGNKNFVNDKIEEKIKYLENKIEKNKEKKTKENKKKIEKKINKLKTMIEIMKLQ